MKFSIQEEEKEKQIFFTFKEASEKTGLPSKTILRLLQSGNKKICKKSRQKSVLDSGGRNRTFYSD